MVQLETQKECESCKYICVTFGGLVIIDSYLICANLRRFMLILCIFGASFSEPKSVLIHFFHFISSLCEPAFYSSNSSLGLLAGEVGKEKYAIS